MDFPTTIQDDHTDQSAQPNELSLTTAQNSYALSNEIINLIFQMQQTGQFDQTKPETNRGCWTPEEDERLQAAVNQIGTKKWTDVAKFVPTRTSKQCRERWFNRLLPNLKHEPFEQWEDDIIIAKQKEIGNRWAMIAKLLQGRSPNAVKNRWHAVLKNQVGYQEAKIEGDEQQLMQIQMIPAIQEHYQGSTGADI
ncbi:Myb-like DNA-binding domain containing protein [Tritrichomonas foetus]|uniref:Myb-like DNA-binding domain containing protein n=1 Tax=Tritrichomonas foetus TaxID=1144522 RepID=A0A1J4JTJ9_9EUKA|nr:Myb-like DNA-binding domain containing protein [Tritrichomonas foetus]|eukprot:OHT00846.1 Myb-like DNA-binding domain containing protein [Tritrichomonas foetus]